MHVRVALVACTIGLLLSGSSCSSGEPYGTLPPTTPTTPPPTTTEPTRTTTPTPPEPTPPALATQDSAPGAEAFARYWLTALDYAYQTGNTKPFRSLGDCRGCKALADGIDRTYSSGGRIEGGRIAVQRSEVTKYVGDMAALIELIYSSGPRRITDHGDIQTSPPEKNVRLLITLRRDDRTWVVTGAQPLT
jgi:hypothetical protein